MSAKLVFFKDVRKRATDLLTKDFQADKQEKRVEYKAESTASGVVIEANFAQDASGVLVGTFKPKLVAEKFKAEVIGEFTTKGDIKVELSSTDQIVQNLKTLISLNQKKGDGFISLGTEFKHTNVFANATLDLGKKSGPGLLLSAVLGTGAYSLGLSGNYQVNKQAVENLEAVLSYRTLDLDLGLSGKIVPDEKTKREAQVVSLSVFHLVNVDTTFGTEASYNLTNKQADLTVGGQYNLSSELSTKAKFNSQGQISLAYIQKINKNVRVVLSTQVDVQNFTTAKVAPLFGFSLNATF